MCVFPKFSMHNLVMQEVVYHISIRLSAILHREKKEPWPTLLLQIGLYEIKNLKHSEAETLLLKRFTFGARSFNPYDPRFLVKDHYARVYYPWIHGACH